MFGFADVVGALGWLWFVGFGLCGWFAMVCV